MWCEVCAAFAYDLPMIRASDTLWMRASYANVLRMLRDCHAESASYSAQTEDELQLVSWRMFRPHSTRSQANSTILRDLQYHLHFVYRISGNVTYEPSAVFGSVISHSSKYSRAWITCKRPMNLLVAYERFSVALYVRVYAKTSWNSFFRYCSIRDMFFLSVEGDRYVICLWYGQTGTKNCTYFWPKLTLLKWHYIVGTVNQKTQNYNVFLDGRQLRRENVVVYQTSYSYGPTALQIGGTDTVNTFYGQISNVAIFPFIFNPYNVNSYDKETGKH
jgi:hypothetical protein